MHRGTLGIVLAMVVHGGGCARSSARPVAPTRPTPVALDISYPMGTTLLTRSNVRWLEIELEARNPGWSIHVDNLGQLRSMSSTFPAPLSEQPLRTGGDVPDWYRKGELPPKAIAHVRGVIARNRRWLTAYAPLEELHVVVQLKRGGAELPKWRFEFYPGAPPLTGDDASPERLLPTLISGVAVHVEYEICTPCQPGHDCSCTTVSVLERPASSELVTTHVGSLGFVDSDLLEFRRVAVLVPNEDAIFALLPDGGRPHYEIRLQHSPGATRRVDSVTVEPVPSAAEVDEEGLGHWFRFERTQPPGIWVQCPGCGPLDLRDAGPVQ